MCMLKGKKSNVEKVYFLNTSNSTKTMFLFCLLCYKVDNHLAISKFDIREMLRILRT